MSNKKEDIFAVGPSRVKRGAELEAINRLREEYRGLKKKEEFNSNEIKHMEEDIIKIKLRLKKLYADFDKGLFSSYEMKERYDFTRFCLLLDLAAYEGRGFNIHE